MNSYSEDRKLDELLNYFSPAHLKDVKTEDYVAKWEELKSILRYIDRINIREFVSTRMADKMQELIDFDNKLFQEMDWVEQTDFFCESGEGHYGITVWMSKRFKLTPPFVRQGTKIPENIRRLYAESRRCFVFEQYNAAIVLSRAIIETVLKMKINLPEESRNWTAGKVLDKAVETQIITENAHWIARKVIKKAAKILHQAKITDEQQETLNVINDTKNFLEELFAYEKQRGQK